jgi:hypothetical protein
MWWLSPACTLDLPDPVVQRVSPDFAWYGDASDVTVLGRDFVAALRADGAGGEAVLLDDFDVSLVQGDVVLPLLDVRRVDDGQVDATIPAGWPAGVYDVVVETPDARSGRLKAGFTLTETRADHFVMSPDDTFVVGTVLVVQVQLVDRDEHRVFEDLEVSVALTPAGQGDVGGLVDEQGAAPGTITGRLGADGEVALAVEAVAPGLLEVAVRPLDAASPIPEARRTVEAVPDAVAIVVVRLPADPFEAVAGAPFNVDFELQDGNGFAVDATELVTVRTECGEASRIVQIVNGSATIPFTFDRATGGTCPEQAITVDDPPGASAPFQVLPTGLDHFDVQVEGGATAGVPIGVSVTPLDPFFNIVAFSGALTFDDGTDLTPDVPCSAGTNGVLACTWTPLRAGQIVLLVSDGAALGVSIPFQVAPNPVPDLIRATLESDRAVAGEPFGLSVAIEDAFGNTLPAAAFVPFDVLLGADPVDCDVEGVDLQGTVSHRCTLTVADTDLTLDVSGADLAAVVGPLDVVNGPLAQIEVVAPGAAVAGDPFLISIAATDAFGNPYVDQSDGIIDLTDATGTLVPPSVALDTSGSADALASLTRAGTTAIDAGQGGIVLGSSADIDVQAGALMGLEVDVLDPWAFAGEASGVVVEAVDAFGNRVEGVAGEGTLSSDQVGTTPTAFALINGVATSAFTWVSPTDSDTLRAEVGALDGEAEPLAVFAHCADGPALAVDFGRAEPIACLVTGAAIFVADLLASTPGSAAIDRFGVAIAGGEATLGVSPAPAVAASQLGPVDLVVVVAQEDGCAAEEARVGWVGLDDGTVTGAIDVVVESDPLVATTGISAAAVTGAVDCTGDPVSAPLRVRADLGTLLGVTASGSGLTVVTDPTGAVSLTLTAAGAPTAGTGTLSVWSAAGTAAGSAAFSVVGDDLRPQVWGAEIVGLGAGGTDEVVLDLSEAVEPGSVSDGVAVVEVDGVLQPPASVTLSADGRAISIVPDDLVADGAVATITVTDEVRDLAGLRLDGGFVGAPGPFLLRFGDPASLDLPVACALASPVVGVFRPDGDDGLGIEADAVVISVSADQAPAWWVLEVRAAGEDAIVRVDHVLPVGTDDEVRWDGRDAAGRVVENGAWSLTISADDGLFQRGTACEVVATVDNVEPP